MSREPVETADEIIDGPWYTADSWTPYMRHINKNHWAWREAMAYDRQQQKKGWKPMDNAMLLATANLCIRVEKDAQRCLGKGHGVAR